MAMIRISKKTTQQQAPLYCRCLVCLAFRPASISEVTLVWFSLILLYTTWMFAFIWSTFLSVKLTLFSILLRDLYRISQLAASKGSFSKCSLSPTGDCALLLDRLSFKMLLSDALDGVLLINGEFSLVLGLLILHKKRTHLFSYFLLVHFFH